MMRTFLGASLEITPQVEEIVLSEMHVDRLGRIRPRLSRANHFRILRAIWEADPDEALGRLRVPTLAVLAHGAGDPRTRCGPASPRLPRPAPIAGAGP